MVKTLKATVCDLADEALIALEYLESLLTEFNAEQTKDVSNEVEQALTSVGDLELALHVWRLDELPPEPAKELELPEIT